MGAGIMSDPCSSALLEAALAGNLPADVEASLCRHLEECDECSAAMERMAGGAPWCQEAAAWLSGDELDEAAPVRDAWSETDFTVEHLEPADEPNVLGRLGGYDVLEILGRGGMGVVLKGYDRELKRCVAIKVLAPHLAHSSLARKRFAREAQAAAAVVHPHVLAIHQVQASGRLPFLVMPLVAGESLAERLAAKGTLELKEVLRIGMQAAAGLAAAHEQGLVHRDVKPANILLEKGVERAVLTDFGLACAADDVALTQWGIVAGTPQYMSPEQARGEPLDGRSDLFSLGCVLYEMATGVSPFRADGTMATMRRLVDDAPQAMVSLNPELPSWFVAIVGRLLEKSPSKRFGSATEVSELLEGCLAHVQQPASVPLPAGVPEPPAQPESGRRNPRSKGVLTMFAIFGVGLLGAVGWLATEPPDIAGQWKGEEWGTVVLKKIDDGEYTGTYTDTFGKKPGEIHLKWSRIERRFNGTWHEGPGLALTDGGDGKAPIALDFGFPVDKLDRVGELSVRLVGNEIRGAFTTDAKSKINPATPRLADLTWVRTDKRAAAVWGQETVIRVPDPPDAKAAVEWQPVSVVLGPKAFRDGDVIEITNVSATSPKFEQGDSVIVCGRVRLASQDQANLYLYLTQTEGAGGEEGDRSQENSVKRGLSNFKLRATIKHRGVLHLTLYDRSGKPFGGVYFGTAAQMKQIENWSLDHYLARTDKQADKSARPPEKQPRVQQEPQGLTLTIVNQRAERMKQWVVVQCEATLENATGKDLTPTINGTPFSSMRLKVIDAQGNELAAVHPDNYWLKPRLRDIVVKSGEQIQGRLAFFYDTLPKDAAMFTIRLEGPLTPGRRSPVLSSNALQVKVPRAKDTDKR
jgi:serine/threonine-protein kinase